MPGTLQPTDTGALQSGILDPLMNTGICQSVNTAPRVLYEKAPSITMYHYGDPRYEASLCKCHDGAQEFPL